MEGIIAYALSKKYTQKSLDGLGALKKIKEMSYTR